MIDAHSGKVEENALISPASDVKGLRGVLPFGMALSPNEKRLYIACAGINAVAVVETDQMQLLGFIPSGWFPARVAVSADGKTLFVANAKGFGAGPNGGRDFQLGPEGAYIGDITKGTVSILTIPKDYQLRPLTLQVMRNNGFVPGFLAQGTRRRRPSVRRTSPFPSQAHPVQRFTTWFSSPKRTAPLTRCWAIWAAPMRSATPRWPAGGWTPPSRREGCLTLEHMQVTPNQHALAKRFAFGDNFYVDSDVSVDGHHWLVGNYPNELLESAWPAAYGGKLDFVPDQDAPGRLDIGASSTIPETYLENGSLWENLARAHVYLPQLRRGNGIAGRRRKHGRVSHRLAPSP